MNLRVASMLSIALLLPACNHNRIEAPQVAPPLPSQAVVDAISQNLTVRYQVLANRSNEPCHLADGTAVSAGNFCYEGELRLASDVPISGSGWEIYFSQVEPVHTVADGEFQIEHINGDLHRLTPGPSFTGFAAGEEKRVSFVVRGQVLNETKLFPNYYVVAPGAEARTIASTRLRTDPLTELVKRPFVVSFPTDPDRTEYYRKGDNDRTRLDNATSDWAANAALLLIAPDTVEYALLPTPARVDRDPQGRWLDLSAGIRLQSHSSAEADFTPPLERLALLGVHQTRKGIPVQIQIVTDNQRVPSSYELEIASDRISIRAGDEAGAAYALYSLAALLGPNRTELPLLTVTDAPRFSFRGVHVDVARNFHSKQSILDLIDQMAAYKLNKLHLHLADDEGWRLEIDGLPELVGVGSKRCHDPGEDKCLLMQLGSGPTGNSPVDGYFTRDDYVEIVRAADARHIQVIPSLDMPGHSRAAVKAMEARYRRLMAQGDKQGARQYLLSDPGDLTEYESIQYYSDNTINVCMDSAYSFVEKVVDEVSAMHRAAGQPLTRYHIGADETAGAWVRSPICQQYIADNSAGVSETGQLGPHFIERVATILNERGIEAAAWNDGLSHVDPAKMPAKVQSNSWGVVASGGAASAHEQANLGWDVVISSPDATYFDFPYAVHPTEGGYYWASRKVDTKKVFSFMPENLPAHAEFWVDPNGREFRDDDRLRRDADGKVLRMPMAKGVRFAGLQGQLWSETVLSDDMMEYQLFPRLLALAERAWHQANWEVPYDHDGALYDRQSGRFTPAMREEMERDWSRFVHILGQRELAKLDQAKIAYRLPPPGGRIANGRLEANILYPGIGIEYRLKEGDWTTYAGPVQVNGNVALRSVSPDGKRYSRTVPVPADGSEQ